jgi:hypothetical protein
MEGSTTPARAEAHSAPEGLSAPALIDGVTDQKGPCRMYRPASELAQQTSPYCSTAAISRPRRTRSAHARLYWLAACCMVLGLQARSAEAQEQPPASPYIWLRAEQCTLDGTACTNLGTSGLAITSVAPAQEYRAQWSANALGDRPALLFRAPAQFVTQNSGSAPFSAEYTQTSVIDMPGATTVYGPSAWTSNDYARAQGGIRHASIALWQRGFRFCQSADIGANPVVQECTDSPPQPFGRKIVTIRATANRREL